MADIPQVLATYDALVGVALGAGLTYGFGALNRRHQETREDKTRWFEARFRAYIDLLRGSEHSFAVAAKATEEPVSLEEARKLGSELVAAVSSVRLVGSQDVVEKADRLFSAIMRAVNLALEEPKRADEIDMRAELRAFEEAARKDLGHPKAPSSRQP
jgi:hypothetical protein